MPMLQTDDTTRPASPPVKADLHTVLPEPIDAGVAALRVRLALLAVACVLVYGHTLVALAGIWMNRDDFSHGFLIPAVSLYLVWLRRGLLAAIPQRPSIPLGLPVMVVAGALLAIGDAGGVVTLKGVSFILMLAGLVLLTAGRDALRVLAFPIGYLAFMVPIFDGIIGRVQWPFQLLTAEMGVATLQALGYTVLLDRQFIVLPSITLEVAAVCSGVGYLVAILAVGVPVAYLALARWWTRVTLIAAAIAIGVVANWFRVALIGAWAAGGGEVVHGPFHVFQGLFVAWIGFGVLFAGAWILLRLERRGGIGPARQLPLIAHADRAVHTAGSRAWWIAMATLAVVGLYLVSYSKGPTPLRQPLSSLPLAIGDWTAQPVPPTPPVRLKADDEILRTYRHPDGREVEVYVAYVRATTGNKDLINDRTAALHRGAEALAIRGTDGGVFTVNAVRTDGTPARRVVFWYEVGGSALADRYRAKWAVVEQALVRGRTHGAFVALSEPVDGRDTSARDMLVAALHETLARFLP